MKIRVLCLVLPVYLENFWISKGIKVVLKMQMYFIVREECLHLSRTRIARFVGGRSPIYASRPRPVLHLWGKIVGRIANSFNFNIRKWPNGQLFKSTFIQFAQLWNSQIVWKNASKSPLLHSLIAAPGAWPCTKVQFLVQCMFQFLFTGQYTCKIEIISGRFRHSLTIDVAPEIDPR